VHIFYLATTTAMVPTIRGRSGKVREKSEDNGKSGNFTLCSHGKLRGSGKVREFKITMVQKLTNTQKNILNCCMQTAYNSAQFFLLASLTDYLLLYF